MIIHYQSTCTKMTMKWQKMCRYYIENRKATPRVSPICGEVHSIQHYVIKFVIDLRLLGGFL